MALQNTNGQLEKLPSDPSIADTMNRTPKPPSDPKLSPKLFLTDSDKVSPVFEIFRAFRNKLQAIDTPQPQKVFVFTGAEGSVGTSSVAFNLGLSFGLEKAYEKTLIVDANFSCPALHSMFDIPKGPGLLDLLLNKAPLEQVVRPSAFPRLSLMPVGHTTVEEGPLFPPTAFVDLIEKIRTEYDFVIIDTAPVLQSGQTDLITSYADGVVLVVEASRTRSEVVGAVQERLCRNGAKLIGSFLNKRKFVIPEWLYRYV